MSQGLAPGFKLQLNSGETLPIFPLGCTVDSGHNDTVAQCCTAVGSTAIQVDGIFGCPYNAEFVPAANQSFGSCALDQGASISCAPASQNSGAAVLHLRWNGLACLLLMNALRLLS
ncbi:hypothetical protein B0H13DRAFT_2325632 [Mycena leptocephala]|nr:hypothetical protein B0H13DRAFT_2325632 [Mycena leptocephala]